MAKTNVSLTLTAVPSATPVPTKTVTHSTSTPTHLPVATATATFLPSLHVTETSEIFPLDNLRMAYIADGNLYVQDGNNTPKKLSNTGNDIPHMFSNDGEIIVLYDWHDDNSVFSVKADGSQKQEIITKTWLDTLGDETKAGRLTFIPNTYQALFNTYLCPEYDPSLGSDRGCTVGLFLVDTDTGEIKEIIAPTLRGTLPFNGDARWLNDFSISPNGKFLAVSRLGHIDIFDMNGEMIHTNVIEYLPGMPCELYAKVYWFPDSSGMIVALPIEDEYVGPGYSGAPKYSIWRYTFDESAATQIPLDPAPVWMNILSNDVISISPNRERAIYFTNDSKLYSANLLNGNTELLTPVTLSFLPHQWSLDSAYFSDTEISHRSVIGSASIDSALNYIFYLKSYFKGWIGERRFIYFHSLASVDVMDTMDTHVFVGEINNDTLLSYESNITITIPSLTSLNHLIYIIIDK